MPHGNHEMFLEYSRVLGRIRAAERLWDRIDKESLDPAQALAPLKTYHDLVRLRDEGFPMLLQSGEPLFLEHDPVQLYLLPPLGIEGERWVLYQAPDRVGLLRWRYSDSEENEDALEPLRDGGHRVDDDLQDVLSHRALKVEMPSRSESLAVITLTFQEGDLQLLASREGIHTHHWQSATRNRAFKRVERRSCADMEPVLRCRLSNPQHWTDHKLEFLGEAGKVMESPEDRLGRIQGADSPKLREDLVYAGGSHGVVYRFCRNSGQLESEIALGGTVEDVLIIQHPEREEGYGILVAVTDGHVYLLDDKDGAEDIKKRHYQYTGQGLVRLIGFGEGHILARDRHNQILPLRIHNPVVVSNIRDELTERFSGNWDLHSEAWFDVVKSEPRLFQPLFRLLLEHYLHFGFQKPLERGQGSPYPFEKWIFQLVGETEPHQVAERVSIHAELLGRFWSWIDAIRRIPMKTSQSWDNKSNGQSLKPLLDLVDLPRNAPDWLWLHLFRYAEWLDHLPELLPDEDENKTPIKEQIRAIREKISRMRDELSPVIHQCRPLWVKGGARTQGYVRHLRRWGTQDRILYIAEGRELVVMTIPRPRSREWREIQRLVPSGCQESGWLGMPTTLIACEDLGALTQRPDAVLLATNRGELRWFFRQKDRSLALLRRPRFPSQVDMDIRCGQVMRTSGGILFGGRSPAGKPALLWLSLGGGGKAVQVLWQGERDGCLRKLIVRPSPQSGNKGLRVFDAWAIEREGGRLLHWRINELWLEGGMLQRREPQCWLNTKGRLYTLAVDDKSGQLVTGGSDGIAYAFDCQSGEPKWVAGCGGEFRGCVHASCGGGDRGYWLLGGGHDHVLIVDKDGQVAGTAEYFGPVTTIAGYDERSALLGGVYGRIAMVSTQEPEPGVQDGNDETGDPVLYPLRDRDYLETLNDREFLNLLNDQLGGDSGRAKESEAIPAICIFSEFVRRLYSEGHGVKWFEKRLRNKLASVSAPRLAWIMRELWRFEAVIPLLELGAIYWNGIPGISDKTNLCQPLNQLLRCLEQLEVENRLPDSGNELFYKIQACVWEREAPCPEGLDQGRRLDVMRLGQVLRFWRNPNEDQSPAERLNEWLKGLSRIWERPGIDVMRNRLGWVIPQLPPLLPSENKAWWDWLVGMVSGLDGDKADLPEPLKLLLPDGDFPGQGGLRTAREAMPNNASWGEWLDRMALAMGNLRKARHELTPRRLWREWECLTDIQALVGSEGGNRFSMDNDQPLLALWWPRVQSAWNSRVQEELLALQREADRHPERYVDVDVGREIWRNTGQLALELRLRNRFPNELSLNGLAWLPDGSEEYETAVLPRPLDPVAALPAGEEWRTRLTPALSVKEGSSGRLLLEFYNRQAGSRIAIEKPLKPERSLARFTDDPAWRESWIRLDGLLKGGLSQASRILWINGDQIGGEEYRRLRDMIRDGFSITPETHFTLFEDLDSALRAWRSDLPVFSPDLALGASPEILLEQLHALIHHSHSEGALWCALSLWHLARPLPGAVHEALADKLTAGDRLEAFLEVLLPRRWLDVVKALKRLPVRGFGAWCSGEPVYGELPKWTNENEAYAPAATGIPMAVWRLLDDNKTPEGDIAKMLGVMPKLVWWQRQGRKLLARLVADVKGDRSEPKAVSLLFRMLGGGALRRIGGLLTCSVSLQVLHESFDRLYYLSGKQAVNEGQYEPGLWLTVREGEEYASGNDFPGRLLALSQDEIAQLLHAGEVVHARALVSRFAARQWGIKPDRVFRVEGGMTESALRDHFFGREAELHTLQERIGEQHHAVLLVGGRRMGKTSLRQKYRYELERAEDPRAIVELDLQDLHLPPPHQDTSVKVLYDFARKLYRALARAGHALPKRKEWPASQMENENRATSAFEGLEDHFTYLKKTSGGVAPLLILDETEKLVMRDARCGYPVFGFLRRLSGEGGLSLIVTSYPYGAGTGGALNVQVNQSGTSLYNFATEIYVGRWLPDESWCYLQEKLAGFGIVLPLSLRSSVLDLTRGIPSSVHMLGKIVCHHEATGRQHLLTPALWRDIAREMRRVMTIELKASVARVAQEVDAVADAEGDGSSKPLDGGRLWRALLDLARRETLDAAALEKNEWPPEQSFSLEALSRQFDGKVSQMRLRKALNRLTSTHVLVGDVTEPDRFAFANDSMPALAHEWETVQ